MAALLQDEEEIEVCSRGDRWLVSWQSPAEPPRGQRHGAAGICVDNDGKLVLISTDEISWDFPAGRPEGEEEWKETLCREVREEACAVVTTARLLGYSRGHRLHGEEIGPALVRSIWIAQVDLLDWNPQFETCFRKRVSPSEALQIVLPEYERLWARAFQAADWGTSIMPNTAEDNHPLKGTA